MNSNMSKQEKNNFWDTLQIRGLDYGYFAFGKKHLKMIIYDAIIATSKKTSIYLVSRLGQLRNKKMDKSTFDSLSRQYCQLFSCAKFRKIFTREIRQAKNILQVLHSLSKQYSIFKKL